MSDLPAPFVHKFETTDAEVCYNAWLCTKVTANLNAPRPQIEQGEVERRMAVRIAGLKARRAIP